MAQNKIRIVTLFAVAAIFSGCNLFKKDAPKVVPYPDWVKSSVIYEVNTQLYSPEGIFNTLEGDLPRLKELGIDILWLMPICQPGGKNRKSQEGANKSFGNYYSIRDYKMINTEFGTTADFKSLITKAHGMGIKVIIDWVAYQTSADNKWIAEHPEWYKKDDKGDIVMPLKQNDCAQPDYSNKGLRKAMVSAMKFWVENFDIDGFRCEMAGLVPTDFWEDARSELQKIKILYMLAGNEDKPELCNSAFDTNNGWKMNHLMSDVVRGKMMAGTILKLQSKIDSVMPQRGFKLNFITQDDENSNNGNTKEKFGNGEKSCAVLTYTLPGMPLIYNGQEDGLTKRHRFLSKDTIGLSDSRMIKFYKTLNGLKHRNPALWTPPYGGKLHSLANTVPDKIVSFLRSSGNSRVMVLVNMSQDSITTEITSTIADGKYINTFNQNKINFNADNRVCYFEPWEYMVLEGE